jgi:serine acetyltransferase
VIGHIEIDAGAKILGFIRLGAYARIGAKAVVLTNVPSGDRCN